MTSNQTLSHTLLENNPTQYLKILKQSRREGKNVAPILNSKVYETWFSNHVMSLFYLVGDLIENNQNTENNREEGMYYEDNFYGVNASITESLGIEIFREMVIAGVDLYSVNYYKYTLLQILDSSLLTSRKNQEKFIFEVTSTYSANIDARNARHLSDEYDSDTNVSQEPSDSIIEVTSHLRDEYDSDTVLL